MNDTLTEIYEGDPKVNESYFNYGSTLYAVADGIVVQIHDGLSENHGDVQDVTLNICAFKFVSGISPTLSNVLPKRKLNKRKPPSKA